MRKENGGLHNAPEDEGTGGWVINQEAAFGM